MLGGHRFSSGLSPDLDISIAGVSSMPVSYSVICFLCPLSMCFESFLLFVLSHILLNREIHIRKVLKTRKHICPGSMKRDCPSLIFAKTQLLFHFRLFFIGHGCEVVSYCYLSYLGFSSTVFCDVTHFSTIVTFRWWSCGWGTVDVHCIFVLYFDRDRFLLGLAWSSLRICPCYLELPFSVARVYHAWSCPFMLPSPGFPSSITLRPNAVFTPRLNWSTKAMSSKPESWAQPLNSIMNSSIVLSPCFNSLSFLTASSRVSVVRKYCRASSQNSPHVAKGGLWVKMYSGHPSGCPSPAGSAGMISFASVLVMGLPGYVILNRVSSSSNCAISPIFSFAQLVALFPFPFLIRCMAYVIRSMSSVNLTCVK